MIAPTGPLRLAELEALDIDALDIPAVDALQRRLVYERGWLDVCRDGVRQGLGRGRADWLTADDGPLGPDGRLRWALDLIAELGERDQGAYPRRRSYAEHADAVLAAAGAALALQLAPPAEAIERLEHAVARLRSIQWWLDTPPTPGPPPRWMEESTLIEGQIATALYELQRQRPDWSLAPLRDLLLELCNAPAQRRWERTATVVVPLAAGEIGLLADLRVELALEGSGQCYPDPAMMLFFEGDAAFREACAAAWAAGAPAGEPPVDARWSLSIRRGPGYTRASAFDCFVVGGSHGAGLALVLRHLLTPGPGGLDANRAITGTIAPDGAIGSVSHYAAKIAALLRAERRLALVYPAADEAAVVATQGRERVRSQAVATLDDALHLMRVRHPAPPPPIDGLVRWSAQGPLFSAPPPGGPRELIYAVGRPAELERCDRQLREHGRAVITGRPGAGKTTLAAIAAARLPAERVFWHALDERPTLVDLLRQIAAFLDWRGLPRLADLAADDAQELAVVALEELRDQELLLCIDDLDADLAEGAVARFLRELQALRPPALTVICTARERPALLRPGEEPVALAEMTRGEALALLALVDRRAPEHPDVEQVIAAAERHPLYLRQAGLLLARDPEPPSSWAARLAADAQIEEHLAGMVDRQLQEEERRILCVVALLGVDQRAVPAAAVRAALGAGEVVAQLRQLSARQLLRQERQGEQLGYRLHRVEQQFFARHESLSARERRTCHERAAGFYEAEGEPLLAAIHYDLAGQHGHAVDLVTVSLDDDADEPALALDRGRSRPWDLVQAGQGARLAALLEPYRAGGPGFGASARLRGLSDRQRLAVHLTLGQLYSIHGRSAEARDTLGVALDYIDHSAASASARRTAAFGYLQIAHAWEHSDPEQALAMVELGLQAAKPLRTPEVQALHFRRASILISQGAYDAAEEAIRQGLDALPPELGSERAGALLKLGAIASSRGDPDHAWRLYEQARHIYEATGDLSGGCGVLHNLGIERELAGDWAGARQLYADALQMAEHSQEAEDRTTVTLSLGILRAKLGHDDEARRLLEHAAALAEQSDLAEHWVAARGSLASLLADRGAWDELGPVLAAAREAAEAQQIGSQLREIYSIAALLMLQRGDYDAAEREAQRAHDVACSEASYLSVGMALRARGAVELARGKLHHAQATLSESVALLASEPYEAARSQAQLARVSLAGGQFGAARSLLEVARKTFSQLGAAPDVATADALLRLLA